MSYTLYYCVPDARYHFVNDLRNSRLFYLKFIINKQKIRQSSSKAFDFGFKGKRVRCVWFYVCGLAM